MILFEEDEQVTARIGRSCWARYPGDLAKPPRRSEVRVEDRPAVVPTLTTTRRSG